MSSSQPESARQAAQRVTQRGGDDNFDDGSRRRTVSMSMIISAFALHSGGSVVRVSAVGEPHCSSSPACVCTIIIIVIGRRAQSQANVSRDMRTLVPGACT